MTQLQFRLSTALAVVGVLAILLAVWTSIPRWDSIEIHGGGISTKQSYQIHLKDEGAIPHGLSVRIRGDIDGIAEVTTHHDSLNLGQTVQFGPGKVDIDYGGDYYDSDAKIVYNPVTAKNGRLKVYYKFEH